MSTKITDYTAEAQADASVATQSQTTSSGEEAVKMAAIDQELTEVEAAAVMGGAYKLRGNPG